MSIVNSKVIFLASGLYIMFINPGCSNGKIFYDSFKDLPAFQIKPFNPNKPPNDSSYIELKDGTRVFGKSISATTGLLAGTITIDGQKFRIKDTRCKVVGETYYYSIGYDYARRIIQGKINIYRYFSGGYFHENGHSSYSSSTTYYFQKGENTDLIIWRKPGDITDYIKDCPEALRILNNKESGTLNADTYLNRTIKIYNKNCRE